MSCRVELAIAARSIHLGGRVGVLPVILISQEEAALQFQCRREAVGRKSAFHMPPDSLNFQPRARHPVAAAPSALWVACHTRPAYVSRASSEPCQDLQTVWFLG